MTRYSVMVLGEGIDIPSSAAGLDEGEKRIGGFYVTVIVTAVDAQIAGAYSMQSIKEEWRGDRLSKFGSNPALKIEDVRRLGLIASFRNRKSGYVSFPRQEHDSGASH